MSGVCFPPKPLPVSPYSKCSIAVRVLPILYQVLRSYSVLAGCAIMDSVTFGRHDSENSACRNMHAQSTACAKHYDVRPHHSFIKYSSVVNPLYFLK